MYLVDTGKAADDDGQSTKVAGLQGSVLTRRTLTVVVVSDDDPLDALVAVLLGNGGNTLPFAGDLVLDLVGLAVSAVDSTNQAILCREWWVVSIKSQRLARWQTHGRCFANGHGT